MNREGQDSPRRLEWLRHPAESCQPPFWARSPHVQTLLGFLAPSRVPEPPWVRLNLKLPDGDTLRLRLLHGRTDLVIHLFHGLEGSADAGYMQRAAAHFREQGHTLLAMNHRGAGEGRGLASRTGHLGSTADLAAVIQAGRGLFPEHLHLAIGFSSGATTLLLLLGRDQGLVQPDRAIAVSPRRGPRAGGASAPRAPAPRAPWRPPGLPGPQCARPPLAGPRPRPLRSGAVRPGPRSAPGAAKAGPRWRFLKHSWRRRPRSHAPTPAAMGQAQFRHVST